MERPAVDVVVPFLGAEAELDALVARLVGLGRREGDTVTVVDNAPGGDGAETRAGVRVLRAGALQTPGYARNRGAEGGRGEWLLFFDADTDPAPDLLDRLFEPAPGAATGLLGGGVRDEPVPPRVRPAARYAYIREAMHQDDTFSFGRFGYPKSANVAVRRVAFDAVGGFRESIRAAEDADLTFRLRAVGWGVERRELAYVVHRNRATAARFAHQKLVHGAGAAWLEREYPGAFPARRRPGLIWWGIRHAVSGLTSAVWRRDHDRALWAVFEPLEQIAFELGRSLPNERPLSAGVWLTAVRRLIPPRGTPRV